MGGPLNHASLAATGASSATPGKPVFFFSYARDDYNKLMHGFFTELLDEIRGQTAYPYGDIAFQDVTSLGAGELWEEHLLRALQNSAVFVAMYTPIYFAHVQGKRCFCGREFAAYWSRSGGGELGSLPPNILPVMWTIPRFSRAGFPPAKVGKPNRELGDNKGYTLPANYQKFGLQWVWSRDPYGRKNMCAAIADEILNLAKTPPAPLPDLPDMDAVPCHFHDDYVEAAEFPTATPSAVAIDGPGRLVLIYANTGPAAADDGEFRVQQEAFRKGQYPQCLQWLVSATGPAGILPTLRTSSEANNTTILVIRAEQLHDQGVYAAMNEVLADASWRGGVLVLGPATHGLSSATAMIGTARTLASLAEELGRLVTGIGSQLRRSGTPQRSTPDGAPPPRF